MLRAVRPPDPAGPGGHIRAVSSGSPTLALVSARGERAATVLGAGSSPSSHPLSRIYRDVRAGAFKFYAPVLDREHAG